MKSKLPKEEKIKRILKSRLLLARAIKRKEKAKAERRWIENNPHIHILNYPFYKVKRKLEMWGFIQ